MEIEHAFIGLEWIGKFDKFVGEVDRISYKDEYWAQLSLVINDKGSTKPSLEKLHENLSFSLFTKGTDPYSPWQSSSRKNCVFIKG